MGYMSLIALCAACGGCFISNPDLVPVIVMEGNRFPVCRPCAERLNAERITAGLKPVPILPGAYEPTPEHCDDDPFDF